MSRSYSDKTLKVLFTLSGDQCAYPHCTNPVIEPATQKSEAHVAAQICHIYAHSADGPRGKPGLTPEELKSPENLILLCGHHHGIVDGQHETYPARMLREWKQNRESRTHQRLSGDIEIVEPSVLSHPYFPTTLVDQKIEEEVAKLQKKRFFVEFDGVLASISLGRRLVEGELSGGSAETRGRALSWCARLLAYTDELDTAEKYLGFAKTLSAAAEVAIANAFIASKKGQKGEVLKALARINTASSRSAAFLVVARQEDAEAALDWLQKAGMDASKLDSEGKFWLLTAQLESRKWESAQATADALTTEDLKATPALHHAKAIALLLGTVPSEFRALVLKQLPLEAASFPIAADASSLDARRKAQTLFFASAEMAHKLNCPRAASISYEYGLWLELMDPHRSHEGRRKLELKLCETESMLSLVPLGLQFGVALDPIAVEQEIEKHIAIHGGMTPDAAIARLSLAFTKKTPKEVADYIESHSQELSKYVDGKSIRFLQIEMLSRSGLAERANEHFKILLEEGLSEAEEGRIRRIIAEAEGADPVEARKKQYRDTQSTNDLVALVNELENSEHWGDLCDYANLLFQHTHSLRDAERFALGLHNANRTDQLVQLCKDNPDLLTQSSNLRILHASALYRQGDLVSARAALAALSDLHDPNCREIQLNVAIALGDWNFLANFAGNEYHAREDRSAQELITAAQLALHLSLPSAKGLISSAAAKGGEDPGVLAAAYSLASNAGWEREVEAGLWLHKAAELSGEDGPIQKIALRDILNRKPDWERRESEIWSSLDCGKWPIFLAARSLNRSLIDLMLLSALANVPEADPRRRAGIPAYSGKHLPKRLEISAARVGMDVTALITLGFLDLLDTTLDAIDTIYLPHSTLAWLWEEKQRAGFHQPSRIRDANVLRDLLGREFVEKFVPKAVADPKLVDQVGKELATLIADAEDTAKDEDLQRIVVRSSPVHRISTLMEQEADLSAHAHVLSSCWAIVERLRHKGQITSEEEKKARSYLRLQEKPWPDQPAIRDGAILYLDYLSTKYFLHLDFLNKLLPAGFRPVVSQTAIQEANELAAYEGIYDQVNQVIERIRLALHSRILSGSVRVHRQQIVDKANEQSIPEHPTFGMIHLASKCDAVVSDDRFLNQHAHVDDGSAKAPVFTTLDLLDALETVGSLSTAEKLEHRTLLRRAGYYFVPLDQKELEQHLRGSSIENGKVIETAELKAIRESFLRVRMSDWLQLPEEAPWLDSTAKVMIRVLKGLWKDCADIPAVTVRSDWILELLDMRGWVHRLQPEDRDNFMRIRRGTYILLLLTLLSDAASHVKNAYWSWLEDRVLVPIKEEFPDLFAWLVDQQRKQIAHLANLELTEDGVK